MRPHSKPSLSLIGRRSLLAAAAALPLQAAWALYDPKPQAAIALAPGAWTGSLTYRDWRNPEQLVKLPCALSIALIKPDELALYYVFDDGPGKTVFSYERMQFDFVQQALVWTSGVEKPRITQFKLNAVKSDESSATLQFERVKDSGRDSYVLELSRLRFVLTKTEVTSTGAEIFRNKYELTRSGG